MRETDLDKILLEIFMAARGRADEYIKTAWVQSWIEFSGRSFELVNSPDNGLV